MLPQDPLDDYRVTWNEESDLVLLFKSKKALTLTRDLTDVLIQRRGQTALIFAHNEGKVIDRFYMTFYDDRYGALRDLLFYLGEAFYIEFGEHRRFTLSVLDHQRKRGEDRRRFFLNNLELPFIQGRYRIQNPDCINAEVLSKQTYNELLDDFDRIISVKELFYAA